MNGDDFNSYNPVMGADHLAEKNDAFLPFLSMEYKKEEMSPTLSSTSTCSVGSSSQGEKVYLDRLYKQEMMDSSDIL